MKEKDIKKSKLEEESHFMYTQHIVYISNWYNTMTFTVVWIIICKFLRNSLINNFIILCRYDLYNVKYNNKSILNINTVNVHICIAIWGLFISFLVSDTEHKCVYAFEKRNGERR